MTRRLLLACLLPLLSLSSALPQKDDAPKPAITVAVDASDFPRNLIKVNLVISAKAGPLTLHYPKWIPGNHAPTGPIDNVTGLTFRADKADGAVIAWKRDETDPHAFHLTVPEGATSVHAAFDLLGAGSLSSSTFGTPKLGIVNWNQTMLYPAGKDAMKTLVAPTLKLPAGWLYGTALTSRKALSGLAFDPVPLAELIDSPVLAGEHLSEYALAQARDGLAVHYLTVACDGPEGLAVPKTYLRAVDDLVAEGRTLFGSRPYRKYRFLLTLSDRTGPSGLEHHESSDNRMPERAMLDEATRKSMASLLPHEYVHAWNGKFRRPADMVVEDFQKPHRTKMLWVYEGLTEYLGFVLTARSGLWTADEAREELALYAEMMNSRKGRSWRPLEDTASASHTMRFRVGGWRSRQRTVGDYYVEGLLLWLEADAMIRTKTDGKKSLDDFCKAFFAATTGAPVVKPYTFEELCAELNKVAEHDWKGHFTRRVAMLGDNAPLEGITLSGWKLTYGDKPTSMQNAQDTFRKQIDLVSSLGLALKPDGAITDVVPGTPADAAGLAPGMKVIAVGGRRFDPARVKAAVASKTGAVDLLVENGDFFKSYSLKYAGGARYPRLEKIAAAKADHLSAILSPKR